MSTEHVHTHDDIDEEYGPTPPGAKYEHTDIDARVGTLLRTVQHLARRSPEVVYGDGEERTRDTPEGRRFCRRVAADGMVLLRNARGVLPIRCGANAGGVKRIAIIGPHAKAKVITVILL